MRKKEPENSNSFIPGLGRRKEKTIFFSIVKFYFEKKTRTHLDVNFFFHVGCIKCAYEH